jgi:hypothetical protein
MRVIFKFFILGVLSVGFINAATLDTKAGYSDGCRTAKGHYTRSAYKYKHSKTYHRGWLRGKRTCKRTRVKKHIRKRHVAKRTYSSCNSEVPWTAFRRGWNHGNRSAKGRFYVDRRGCAAYRQGWVNGYRDCHCGDLKKPDSYAEGYYAGCVSVSSFKIRDDYYYTTRSGYRHGWIQGYKDCRGIYR